MNQIESFILGGKTWYNISDIQKQVGCVSSSLYKYYNLMTISFQDGETEIEFIEKSNLIQYLNCTCMRFKDHSQAETQLLKELCLSEEKKEGDIKN